MFNIFNQLVVEYVLSGAKPYLASHPDLGVPLGIFNTKDEPNKAARIKSIKKYGKRGNPLSYKIAQKLGISLPIPSFTDCDCVQLQQQIDDLQSNYDALQNTTNSTTFNTSNTLNKITGLISNLEKETKASNMSLDEIMGMYESLLTGGGQGMKGRQQAIKQVLGLVDDLRKSLTTTVGMGEQMMESTMLAMTTAAQTADGFNLSYLDVLETMERTYETVGRQLSIPPDVMGDMAKIDSLFGQVSADFVANFDKIGGGAYDATQAIKNTIQVAANMGVTVSKLLPAVQSQIAKINTYGFKNGVDGLTKMVAKSQLLGLNMDNVFQTADKAFTPEGAVEMASKLQMIGGAADELLDPFQLMYMAQNDTEALQQAIIDSTESAVSFNEATGEFGISPSERMRLKAMADATGQDYENLAETAIRNAKRTQALAQFEIGGEIDEGMGDLIASMADFKDGKGVITVKDETGEATTYALDELNERAKQQPGLLDAIREQAERDSMTIEDVNKQQLTIAEAQQANVQQILNLLASSAVDGVLGVNAKQIAEQIQQTDIGAENIVNQIDDTMETVITDFSPAGDIEAFATNFQQYLQGGLPEQSGATPDVQVLNDFILKPDGSIKSFDAGTLRILPNPADTIMGGTQLLNNINTTTATNTVSNTTMGGSSGSVKITGELNLKLGPNSMNISANDIFRALSPPDYQTLALSLAETVGGPSPV